MVSTFLRTDSNGVVLLNHFMYAIKVSDESCTEKCFR